MPRCAGSGPTGLLKVARRAKVTAAASAVAVAAAGVLVAVVVAGAMSTAPVAVAGVDLARGAGGVAAVAADRAPNGSLTTLNIRGASR